MLRQFMLGKLHRAVVTRADLDYVGSVSIDSELMRAVGIIPYEKVLIVNVNTGVRFETYAIEAPARSRTIGMNGGCAHLAKPGDICLIMAFAWLSDGETIRPKTAIMGEGNEIVAVIEDEVIMPGIGIREHCSN